MKFYVLISANKFTQVRPYHYKWPDQWQLQWVAGCL